MFSGFIGLRALVLLRQISRELSRANDLAELRLSIEHPGVYKSRIASSKRKGPVKSGSISTGNVERWNESWEKSRPKESQTGFSDIP